MSHRVLLVALACLADGALPAQENKAENQPQGFAAERALLQRMIDRMSALPACTFTVEQEQKSDIGARHARAAGGQVTPRRQRSVTPAHFFFLCFTQALPCALHSLHFLSKPSMPFDSRSFMRAPASVAGTVPGALAQIDE